ncbi:MAG: integration host factor subunit beta [Candidatus Acidulodesulfobacterium ferriphilum]|uniref:Integration host factor subunit beta n=1 Tax=Candidatus Acidulodesulfobacterium ferriphilum TaxID=2597223 RepID=A0A519BBH7_9DELT|nr:MAG: integration host factor subunit beta [Candidatus Acidulodesulfobacterium ferriphilum]
MNKADFIEKFAKENNISVKISGAVVNTILDTIKEALIQKKRVEIRGFGSFSVKEYDSYTGRNPKTGESIGVQNKLAPFFKMSKIYKNNLINEND